MGNNRSRATSELLPAEYILPTATHTATVIFLHGLGDSGNGWCEQFRQYALPHVKYIFPNAPSMPVTLTGGVVKPAWFDVLGITHDAKEDEEGVKRASNQLKAFISSEEAVGGISRSRIIIGGFSQGGAVALYSAVMDGQALAGVLAFSTWLPLHRAVAVVGQARVGMLPPIMQCHGTNDAIVPYKLGLMTAGMLKQLSPAHELQPLPGVAHGCSEEGMKTAKAFILEHLPPV